MVQQTELKIDQSKNVLIMLLEKFHGHFSQLFDQISQFRQII